jgi:predicted MFS family arabinose efflux permease
MAVAVVAWGFTALAGTWTAGRLGNRASAAILGLLVVAVVILNVVQLPYPAWFKSVTLTVIPLAGTYGSRLSSRRAAEFARRPPRMPEGAA